MIFLHPDYEVNEAENLLNCGFFQNNWKSSISIILVTNGRKDGRTAGQTNNCEFNTSLAEVINNSLYVID